MDIQAKQKEQTKTLKKKKSLHLHGFYKKSVGVVRAKQFPLSPPSDLQLTLTILASNDLAYI